MPRYLITGFGPFPGCPVNPTATLAEAVARELGIDWRVLPVTWETPRAFAASAAGWDGVLALGVAHGRQRVEVERRAWNHADGRLDAAGVCGGSTLAEDAPECLVGRFGRPPYDAVVEGAAASGLPVGYSDDAGRYLCNATYFHLLHGRGPDAPVGFVHVPHVRGVSAAPDDPDALDADVVRATLCRLAVGFFGLVSVEVAPSAP